MHVERYGHGPRHFLCLHGWSGDYRTFEPLLRGLPDDVTLWCPDLPGCGQSPHPAAWTLTAIADELERFARTLPAPLQIVGNCSGALFGLLLAQRLPVERIFMIDAFAYWPLYFRVFLAPVWGRYAYMTAFANPLGRWLANRSLASHRTASTDLTEGFSRVDHDVTYRYLQMLSAIESPAPFADVRASIHILWGERSFAAIRHSVPRWKQVFPRALAEPLPGAGHLPIREAAAALQRIVFEHHAFLRTNFEENPCRTTSMNSAR